MRCAAAIRPICSQQRIILAETLDALDASPMFMAVSLFNGREA
ncbi:Uncharacterised protein [Bordetella pertussis]|nr:Uncharacterised protein [Bordetella pertussis]